MPSGTLQVYTALAENAAPLPGVTVLVLNEAGTQIARLTTNDVGSAPELVLTAPDEAYSLDEANTTVRPYAVYQLRAEMTGFQTIELEGVQVFAGQQTVARLQFLPAARTLPEVEPETIPEHPLFAGDGGSGPAPIGQCADARVLSEVVVPKKITVHLARPAVGAANVTVSFQDYIANVASSEVYPTWPEQALRANILAQISLALNRIWTEWYPSRGYSFNITGSPGYDQAYVNGRTVFAVMERLTAELFNTFVQRSGDVEPYFTEYCDGKTVTCPGMKQWGTVDRAREGMNALQILRYYYGNRVQLVTTDNIAAIPSSYPGSPLRRGSTGTNVRILQKQLSRIAKDYPSFGKPAVTGTFDEATENSVKKFQKQFSLTADGVVGQRTWNTLYAAWVDAQSDLGGTAWPGTALRRGAAGMEVRLVQFWLRLAADNYSALRTVTVDGSYGAATVSAVEAFQTLFGLTSDGVVGRSTWNKLKEVGLAVANKIVAANVAPGQFTTTTRAGSSGTAVRAVQYYLRRLAAYYSDVPRVAVDGKFGAATTRAVKAWQSRAGLTVDGVVGQLTFQSLYDAAQALEASGPVVRTVSLPAPAATLRPGDTGAAVLRLNRLLLFLSQWIPEINFTASDTPGSTFDLELETAVRSAQRYFGLTETGAVTAADWKVFRDAAEQLLAANPAGIGRASCRERV